MRLRRWRPLAGAKRSAVSGTIWCLSALLLFAAAGSARAETTLDFLYGVADSDDGEVTAHYQLLTFLGSTSAETATRRTSFETSDAFAVRLAHFLEQWPWLGVAGEVAYYQADGPGVDIDVLPLSALLLLRTPTYGGPYPYAGFGLAWATADVDLDFRPQLSGPVRGTADGFGPDLRLGLAWPVGELWGVFFEYRYLDLEMDMDDVDDVDLFAEEIEEADFDLQTQFFMGGISMRF